MGFDTSEKAVDALCAKEGLAFAFAEAIDAINDLSRELSEEKAKRVVVEQFGADESTRADSLARENQELKNELAKFRKV